MSLEELENKVVEYIKNYDYDYYSKVFGYSKWDTIKSQLLNSFHGYYGDGGGYSFTPKGVTLDNGENTKFISAKTLKKIVEGEGEEQLKLFL